MGDWFCTSVGMQQGCLLSPILFNIYMEIMSDAIENYNSTVSIEGAMMRNLNFAVGIDNLAGSED